MKENIIKGVMIASLVSGFVYWVVVFWGYLISMLGVGKIPLDAFLMLLPILIFSLGGGLLLGVPSYLLMSRMGIDNIIAILVVAVVLAILIVSSFLGGMNGTYEMYSKAAFSGLIGGLVFCFLIRNSKMKRKMGDL